MLNKMKRFVVVILVFLLLAFCVISYVYPFSFISINKRINFNPDKKITEKYDENLGYLNDLKQSQKFDGISKEKLETILDFFKNPIFIVQDKHVIPKADVRKLSNDMSTLVIDIRQLIRETGKKLSNDQFDYLVALKARFEEYNEQLKNDLDRSFISESQWNKILGEFHKNFFEELKQMKVLYEA